MDENAGGRGIGTAEDYRQPQWLRNARRAATPYNVGGSVTDALAAHDLTRGIAPEAGYAANVLTGAAPMLAVPGGAGGGLMRQAATAGALRAPAAGGMAAQAGASTPAVLGTIGGLGLGGYLLSRALRKKPKHEEPPHEEPKPKGPEAGYIDRMDKQLEEEGK